jgi:two-component system, NarL family, sensor histidine kinase UhpB
MKDLKRTKSDLIRELKSLRRGVKRLETKVSKAERMEAESRADSEKFKTVADFTSDWECWIDVSGRFLYNSPSCEGITGYPPESFARDPKLLLKIVHPDDRIRVEEHMASVKKRRNDASIDFRIRTKGGDIRWIGHRCRSILSAGGKWAGIRGSNRDITERKSAEMEMAVYQSSLRELASRLVHTQEMERKEISRELHDEIGQSLTAIKINLSEIEKDIPQEIKPRIRMRISESDSLIDVMLDQIHELSLDLHPGMLDDLGMMPTLLWYGKRFTRRVGVDVTIDSNVPRERMDFDSEMNLFRIVQEALTNVAKHAKAKKVLIRMNLEQSQLKVTITDDGGGFEAKDRDDDRTGRMGLTGMRERVNILKGSLEIDSEPGCGTRLLISVPWKRRENVKDPRASGRRPHDRAQRSEAADRTGTGHRGRR